MEKYRFILIFTIIYLVCFLFFPYVDDYGKEKVESREADVVKAGAEKPGSDKVRALGFKVNRLFGEEKLGSEVAVSISKIKESNQPMILHFWATWCGPCLEEMPKLVNFIEQHPEAHMAIIAIYDETEEVIKYWTPSLRKRFLDRPVLLSVLGEPSLDVLEVYKLRGVPTTVFINGSGYIEYISSGSVAWEKESVVIAIEQFYKGEPLAALDR